MKCLSLLWIPAALLTVNSASYAAGLGQQSESVEETYITGEAGAALSARSASEAIRDLEKIPGGIGLVRAEDYLIEFTQSIGDALEFTPGVFADTSAQRENRISIRGSGANATFERRGITVLRDGVPISRASGITEYQEIDPLSIDYIEVYKGSNGLRFGAASLGGAINVVTPTGATSPAGTNLRVEGGSFDTYRASANTKGKTDEYDYYTSVTKLNSNGFREHAEVDSIYSFSNIGIKLSDNIETRFYFTALQDNFELAGSVSEAQALNDPEPSPPVNILLDQDRDLDVFRLSNKTVFALDAVNIELGSWISKRRLDHAITDFVGIIDQEETETGVSFEVKGTTELGATIEWIFGSYHAEGVNDARVFDYRDRVQITPFFSRATGPAKGDVISDDDQNAKNTVVYGQLDFGLTEKLNLILSAQYVRSTRKNQNILSSGEDDSGRLRFEELNGRLGLLYSLNDRSQVYFNISEGYEPPGISDLTSGGADPFTELEAQKSSTIELGSRGHSGPISWDITLYRSEIENEFIDIAQPSFGGTTTNTANAAGETVHQGLELGLDIRLHETVVWRNIFTYNDFSFDDDPVYINNTIPGIPEAVYVSELKYKNGDKWYAGVNFRHIANGAFSDYQNTHQVQGYHLFGLVAGVSLGKSIELFASAENLSDKTNIANVSTVANFSSASNTNIFTPGEGRAFYIGVNADF